MAKKKVPTINVRRVMDDRRSATDAFISLILREGKNLHPTLENQTTVGYNVNSVIRAASQEG